MNWRELQFAPAPNTYLCEVTQIPDQGGWEVTFGEGKEPFRLLLLRRDQQIWAYHNSCPHFSIPLNFEPQHFIVMDGELIMCAHHTAFFNFDDGLCVDGPCTGSTLLSIPVYLADGSVFVGE
jgi:nitrite reductase/ring-hydroxylating ferredoxin subunit